MAGSDVTFKKSVLSLGHNCYMCVFISTLLFVSHAWHEIINNVTEILNIKERKGFGQEFATDVRESVPLYVNMQISFSY